MAVRPSAELVPAGRGRGVFLSMAQLPAGATQERTQKVLDEMTNYYLTKEKDNVESVFAVNGFGFAGRARTPVSRSFR